MATKGMKNRVVQAAVCMLGLVGLAVGASSADPEFPVEAGGAMAWEVPSVWGVAAAWEVPSVWGVAATWEVPSVWGVAATWEVPSVWGVAATWEVPSVWGVAAVQEAPGVWGVAAAQEAVVEIARPLHIVSRIVSVVEGYEKIEQMLAPHRYESTIDDFLHTLDWHLENYGDESVEVVEAVCGLLDNQGELYFGNYRAEEIKVFSNRVYDDIWGDEYWQYSFFLPGQPQPKACIYLSMRDGYVYGCTDSYFWCNDPQTTQMPGVHSCIEEGKRRISDYLEIVSPGTTYEIAYKGLERKDELEQYMQALQYAVSEKHVDGKEITWEAYVDPYLVHGYEDYFYAEMEQNSYEKRQLCNWKSEEGDSYCFAFSKSFQIEEDGSWKCGSDWKVIMLKGSESERSFVFNLDTEDYDWYGEMRIDDYNFDGIPDIAWIWGRPANWGGRSTTIYVWDEKEGYHDAGVFSDVPSRDASIQTIYEFTRGGYGDYFYYAYQYRDGMFACISTLEEEFMEDDSITYTIRDEAGNEEVYKDELPDKWKELWW